ncbi:MAG: hypothetical protein NOU37_09620 [Candidatus Brocadiales bacterium]|nr:hypothetical protein [Candidatus Bathyanammoxibius amoris]
MNTPCVIGSLEKRRDEIEQRIEEELKLNEKRSTRIRDMEAIQVAVTDCIRWMRKHAV